MPRMTDAVARALDGHKLDDMFAHAGEFRASSHAAMHGLSTANVRSPAQLPGPHAWDDVLATAPAATAFPVETECRMAP